MSLRRNKLKEHKQRINHRTDEFDSWAMKHPARGASEAQAGRGAHHPFVPKLSPTIQCHAPLNSDCKSSTIRLHTSE